MGGFQVKAAAFEVLKALLNRPARGVELVESAQAGRGEKKQEIVAREMWSFGQRKKSQRWLWWVEDAASGQVVAFVFGRRTHATFRRLLAVLATAGWAVARWVAAAWGAYETCLPAEQRQTGKGPMQRLERKHLPLRTRLKRLISKFICFFKKQFLHDGGAVLSEPL